MKTYIESPEPKKKIHSPFTSPCVTSNKFKLSQRNRSRSTAAKSECEFDREIKIFYESNEYYEGNVNNSKIRDGYGTYYYSNKDTYEGEFLNGLRHGQGEYSYSDGGVYTGEWRNDLKDGRGKYIYKDITCSGKWEQDRFLGDCKLDEEEYNSQDELKGIISKRCTANEEKIESAIYATLIEENANRS